MAQITKRTTAGGDPRYDVRVRIDGRVVTKTFRRPRDADAWAAEMAHERFTSTAIDPRAGAKTLSRYADTWLQTRRIRGRPLAPKTMELYRMLLDIHVLPTLGQRSLGAITSEQVRRWQAEVSTRSPGQAAKSYRLLRAILNTAEADRLIPRNPCSIPGAGVERAPERPIVDVEVVFAIVGLIAARLRALVLLAAFGGLRLGELCALRRRHVDLLRGTVLVEEQVVSLSGGRRLVTEPKTEAGSRTVALPVVAVEALAEHLARRVGPDPEALLFPSEGGGLLPKTTFYRAWRPVREALGYPKLHLHDLRHLAGTLAAQTGATQREVMARMGHASPAAALRYQHAASRRDQRIAAELDALIAAAGPSATGARDGRAMGAPGRKREAMSDSSEMASD